MQKICEVFNDKIFKFSSVHSEKFHQNLLLLFLIRFFVSYCIDSFKILPNFCCNKLIKYEQITLKSFFSTCEEYTY